MLAGYSVVRISPSIRAKSTSGGPFCLARTIDRRLHTKTTRFVHFDGEDIDGLDPRQRPVSLVFQAFVSFRFSLSEESFDSPMRAGQMSAPERRKRVDERAAMLHDVGSTKS